MWGETHDSWATMSAPVVVGHLPLWTLTDPSVRASYSGLRDTWLHHGTVFYEDPSRYVSPATGLDF